MNKEVWDGMSSTILNNLYGCMGKKTVYRENLTQPKESRKEQEREWKARESNVCTMPSWNGSSSNEKQNLEMSKQSRPERLNKMNLIFNAQGWVISCVLWVRVVNWPKQNIKRRMIM